MSLEEHIRKLQEDDERHIKEVLPMMAAVFECIMNNPEDPSIEIEERKGLFE